MNSDVQLSRSQGIVGFEDLVQIVGELRNQGRTIALCHGVFDLLHIGHIRHLQRAARLADVLIVTLTPDIYVNKGPHRPAFNEQLRAEALAALSFVDHVAINLWPNAVNTIEAIKPDLYVKGSDYKNAEDDKTGGITREEDAVKAVGGALTFTDELTFSSSKLINRYLPLFPKEMQRYLEEFSTRFTPQQVHGWIEETNKLKVLLLGETIIDEYRYCRTMGKSGKEPVLAACYERKEVFPGGILAVANHCSNFTNDAHLISFIGKTESYSSFIEESLNEALTKTLLEMESGPTIVKTRFVESYPFQKLFEVYRMECDESCPVNSQKLTSQLESCIDEFDLVVVVDYGHGMFSPEVVELLTNRARYLALNTQINAGNQGFNTISKYPRADYICLSENEIRMDVRQREHPLPDIIRHVSEKLDTQRILVTRGQDGLTCFDRNEGLFDIPAFTGHAMDRVGAGDAVLAVTSLLAKNQVPIEAVGLIGNAVGFQKVQCVGNEKSIDRISLIKFLDHSLI